MNTERIVKAVAGIFIVASVALGYFINPYFFLFTAFVALNLFQSAFTNTCPMTWMLKKAGVKSCGE